MDERLSDFQYRPLITTPEQFRQIGLTEARCFTMPFADGEAEFSRLRDDLAPAVADDPFLRLQLLRNIQGRLLMLALRKKEPIDVCLRHLRARLDLEYDRHDISGKEAAATELAHYAGLCGERRLALYLLKEERSQLDELMEICRGSLQSVAAHLALLERGNA